MASVVAVIGLGFGDEGKGVTVDALTRELSTKVVCRFNGGAQAGHNVIAPDGRHHRFAQWGSGTFAGARTHLSRYMLVNPIFAMSEARHLQSVGIADPLSLLTVDGEAIITTPFHVAANRIEETARGLSRHGSCGMGIGQTREDELAACPDVIHARDLCSPHDLRRKLRAVQERKRAHFAGTARLRGAEQEWSVLEDGWLVDHVARAFAAFAERAVIVGREWFIDVLRQPGHVVFEGAQGVLLDETHGFQPHTTWTDCTFKNATRLLADTPDVELRRLGILRAFHTRHGDGPFPTEDSGLQDLVASDHNGHDAWQRHFRVGHFDLVLAKHALEAVGQCDGLVLTHLDKVREIPLLHTAVSYRGDDRLSNDTLRRAVPTYRSAAGGTDEHAAAYAAGIADALRVPLEATSWGPTANDWRFT